MKFLKLSLTKLSVLLNGCKKSDLKEIAAEILKFLKFYETIVAVYIFYETIVAAYIFYETIVAVYIFYETKVAVYI